MRRRWYSNSLEIKGWILHILFALHYVIWIGGIVFALAEADNPKNYKEGNEWQSLAIGLALHITTACTFVAYINTPHLLSSFVDEEMPTSPSNIEERNLITGFTGSFICSICVLIQFLMITLIRSEILSLLAILSVAVLGFCFVEVFRLHTLYKENAPHVVPDFGYFKFVMAASICTEYYLHGYGKHLWIVVSACMALTFLYGNYFHAYDLPPSFQVDDHLDDLPQ